MIFKEFIRPKTGDLQKKKKGLYPKNVMKSGVSPQKLQKYRWQTPIWASICTPIAPSQLIFRGTVLAWGAQFSFWGAQAVIWGARPRNAPPWRRACSIDKRNALKARFTDLAHTYSGSQIKKHDFLMQNECYQAIKSLRKDEKNPYRSAQ